MGREADYGVESQSPPSGSCNTNDRRKKRKLMIGVVVGVIIFAVIMGVGVPVVVNQLKKDGGESSEKHGHICGFTLPEGLNMSSLKGPKIMSHTTTCDIKGTCWTKAQCFTCMEGLNRDYVGNINDIPVCCPNCIRSGLAISSSTCDCRYNS